MVKPKNNPAPVLTVAAAARELSVTREHLSRVLHGHRQSRRLTRRYAALRAERQLAA